MERTLALVKPDAVRAGKAEEIKLSIEQHGFRIQAQQRLQMTKESAEELYAKHKGKEFYAKLVDFMTSGPVEALVLAKDGAVKGWRDLLGPTDNYRAIAPHSLRAAYGTDNLCNALHGSKTPDVAAKEVEFFFPGSTFEDPSPLTSGAEWTLGLVKPDATAAGKADEIKLLAEMNGFTIIAAQKMQLTRARAEEFYAEHYGKEFFPKLVDFMTSGPIWALCLSRRNAIKGWRELMGPTNVFKAREEAPRSLRALYGSDGTCNATHGSDSPASARREIKFFFPTLVLEPLLDAESAAEYITSKLQPALAKALTALARERPTAEKFEAITFLADFLLTQNPNKPRIVTPDQWDPSMEDDDDEAEFVNARPVSANGAMAALAPQPKEDLKPLITATRVSSASGAEAAAESALSKEAVRPNTPPASREVSRQGSAVPHPPKEPPSREGLRPSSALAPSREGSRPTSAVPPPREGSRPTSAVPLPREGSRPTSAVPPPREGSRPTSAVDAGASPLLPGSRTGTPTMGAPAETEEIDAELLEQSAAKVQAAFRGHQARKSVDQMRANMAAEAALEASAEPAAAEAEAAAFTGHAAADPEAEEAYTDEQRNAVVKMQAAGRGMLDRKRVRDIKEGMAGADVQAPAEEEAPAPEASEAAPVKEASGEPAVEETAAQEASDVLPEVEASETPATEEAAPEEQEAPEAAPVMEASETPPAGETAPEEPLEAVSAEEASEAPAEEEAAPEKEASEGTPAEQAALEDVSEAFTEEASEAVPEKEMSEAPAADEAAPEMEASEAPAVAEPVEEGEAAAGDEANAEALDAEAAAPEDAAASGPAAVAEGEEVEGDEASTAALDGETAEEAAAVPAEEAAPEMEASGGPAAPEAVAEAVQAEADEANADALDAETADEGFAATPAEEAVPEMEASGAPAEATSAANVETE